VNATDNRIDRSTADTAERSRRQYWSNRGARARGRQYQQHSLLRMHAVCRSILWLLLSCAVGGHYRDNPHFDRYCKQIGVFVQNRSCIWRRSVMTVKTIFSVTV